MNRKLILVLVVVLLVVLCALVVIYAPTIMQALVPFHRIPQH